MARGESIIATSIVVYNVNEVTNAASQLSWAGAIKDWADDFGTNEVGKEKCNPDGCQYYHKLGLKAKAHG